MMFDYFCLNNKFRKWFFMQFYSKMITEIHVQIHEILL